MADKTDAGGAAPAVITCTPREMGTRSSCGAWIIVFSTTGAAQKCVTLCSAMALKIAFAVTCNKPQLDAT